MGKRGPKSKKEKEAAGAHGVEILSVPAAYHEYSPDMVDESPGIATDIVLPEASAGVPFEFKSTPIVFESNRWIYHETHEPKILKAGSPMPEGWQLTMKFERVVWSFDAYGKWSRTEK